MVIGREARTRNTRGMAATIAPISTAISLLGFGASGLIIGALHFIAPTSQLDPYRVTISQYSLSTLGWLFNIGVIALVIGSAAAIIALVSVRELSIHPVGLLMLAIWTLGMAGVATFEKTNWAYGPSASGTIHRILSLIAFLALPIGVLWILSCAGAAWRQKRGRIVMRFSAALGIASAGYLIYLVVLVGPGWSTGRAWWQTIPLGLTERTLVVLEVASLAALVIWATRAQSKERRPVHR